MNPDPQHSPTHPVPGQDRHNDLNVTAILLTGFLGAIVLFATIILLQILYQKAERGQLERKVVAQMPEDLIQLRSQQIERLNSYRVLDPRAGTVALPIDEAVRLVAQSADPAAPVVATAPATEPTEGATQPGGAAATAPAGQGQQQAAPEAAVPAEAPQEVQ